MQFTKTLALRWSDLDPVGHIRHSVYYDLCASMRLEMLQQIGLGIREMQHMGIGPVLFKESCSFRRELHFGDSITLNFQLMGLSPDLGRFAFRHEFWKGETFCARLEVIGAWIDLKERKLTLPPASMAERMQLLPKTDDFTEVIVA